MDKGAHFYRCDLQVHTPRDRNWGGSECSTDEQRKQYATNLVQACRAGGLQGIAITDHHDMAFVEYVRAAVAEESDNEGKPIPKESQLVVFPGMELTLGVPCQALLLFDADLPSDLFPLALTALAINPSAPSDSKTAQTERLNHIESLSGLKKLLDRHQFLRNRYIIFPNVGENGAFSLIRKGFPGKYIEMPCVGGYFDGELKGNMIIVSGKAKEWGNKRIACFQTSDNRFEDHRDLGRVSTWIKWATPSAEALRQACLAQESRVSQSSPRIPSIIIASISVSNSSFLGPVDLAFNPQYNALIGGRGTGKSTILEYLRWGLCDQPPRTADEETTNYQARRSRLIEQTLKPWGATVEIRFLLNDVPHVLRRNSQDGSLLIKISGDDMRSCAEEEVRILLPIQAYSQKQLSDVSVRVEELSRFISTPISLELDRIERQLADCTDRIRQTYATRRRQVTLGQTLQRRELEERSLTEQASAARAGLTGLSEEDRALLDKGQLYEEADRSVQSWLDDISSLRQSVSTLLLNIENKLEQLQGPPRDPELTILGSAHEDYRKFLSDSREVFRSLIGCADTSRGENSSWAEWKEKVTAFRAAYEAAVKRSSVEAEQISQLKRIEEKLGQHVRETQRVRTEHQTLTVAEANYQAEREAWSALQRERDTLLNSQCEALTQNSGGAIRARMSLLADPTKFQKVLQDALSGSRIASSKIEALAQTIITATDRPIQLNMILQDLEKLASYEVEKEGGDRRPDTPTLSSSGFTTGELDRLARSLRPENWLTLSLTSIDSLPNFEYRAKEGEYIPFRNASIGQQATALLRTLLNQGGPPLIIDQPEEDLDNPVMLEIVEQVWQAKQKRQLIFASHNANLVVNGDAELVAWCDYRTAGDQSRGTIAGEGAIDVPAVRDAIQRIMEGGEAAFNLRKEKYGF